MIRYAAFLRGINVGGKNVIKMEKLKASFENYGFKNVVTFIQSGNILFDYPAAACLFLENKIEKGLLADYKSEIKTIVRSVQDLISIVEHNPFHKTNADNDKKFYVCFCKDKPPHNLPRVSVKEACNIIYTKNKEIFVVSSLLKNGRYGFPNNYIEKELGIISTTRNWNTICKMVL